MSDIVIKAENLGKRYTIGHQRGRGDQTTFREVLVQNARNLWNKSRDLIAGKPVIAGETLEEVWALKDVSFEIKRGEAVGIIGRNGAGKSTLLKILSRITEPAEGRVTIRGRVASLLEVGTGFHSELTGRENIYLNGTILGMTRAEIRRKFDEIVAFSEVERYLDTPVKRYSSGMYVRLAFAVAAHLEPEILVVDEVLAVGDAEFQKKCLGKMENVAQEGRTVLFVSHNMSAVRQLCKRALVMANGAVIMQDSSEVCIDAYLNLVGTRSGLLIEHLLIVDSSINITKIMINENTADVLHVVSTLDPLHVEIEFSVVKDCRISLYAYLKSKHDQALGVYSPGHTEAVVHHIKPGFYKLSAQISLPSLAKGTYFFDIGIHDPNIKTYVHFPFALQLHVEGAPAKTGFVFEENKINGFIVLSGSVNITTR